MHLKRAKNRLISIGIALLISLPAFAYTVPKNVGGEGEAELVVRAVCVKKTPKTVLTLKSKKSLPVIEYSWKVLEIVQGESQGPLVFKQINFKSDEEARQNGFYFHIESASFKEGEEYLLFLGKESSLGVRNVIQFQKISHEK